MLLGPDEISDELHSWDEAESAVVVLLTLGAHVTTNWDKGGVDRRDDED